MHSLLSLKISITVTDSDAASSTFMISVVIEPVNDHRPILRFLNATPGCFRLGPSTANTPNSAPAAALSPHNTTLVERVSTNVWTAYNTTSDFLATYGPAVITPSVLLALLAAVGTGLLVLVCYCRFKRGTKRQRGTAKLGRRAQKYIFGTESGAHLPVAPRKAEKEEVDMRSSDRSNVPPPPAKVGVQRRAPPPAEDSPAKGNLPNDSQKKRKKRREPVTLASLAARRVTSVREQERSHTQLAKTASSDDGRIVKERLQPEGQKEAKSTSRSQHDLTHTPAASAGRPSEALTKGRESRERKVEVLSPRRVVNATNVSGRSAEEEGRDVFGDLPQRVSSQYRSCGGLKQDATRFVRGGREGCARVCMCIHCVAL